MIWVYNILLTLLSPIWVPWMLWRANRRKEKVNWKQRSGDYKLTLRPEAPRLWLHAVSVGEVVAATPILREVRRLAPEVEIVLSVTTSSGHQTAIEKSAGLYDHLVYFPIDVSRFCLAALSRIRPRVVAIMETELWFNFLWTAKNMGAKTILLNGRISDRTYPRNQKLKFFFAALLSNVDFALMQSSTDAERLTSLGAKTVEVLGNCKFDEAMEGQDADPQVWRDRLNIPASAKVIVIGSTRGQEEEVLVLDALAAVKSPNIYVIHAPRHKERAAPLAALVKETGQAVALRSLDQTGPYLILDSYGELAAIYGIADVVVIGGGFANLGGQNILQPLAHGRPVIHGPHMQNFRDVTVMADRAGATRIATTAEELGAALDEILRDPTLAAKMGAAAKKLIQENQGASSRYAARLVALLCAKKP